MPAFHTPVSTWETFLNGQRWYGSKGAAVESVEALASRRADGLPLWALLCVELCEPDRGRSDAGAGIVQVCSLRRRGDGRDLEEDFEAAAFWEFLREASARGASVEGGRLELSLDGELRNRLGSRPGVLPGEMSNTLLRAGEGVLLKVYRRVEAGTHPETEALGMLSEQGFEHAPRLHGVGRFVDSGKTLPDAVVMACLEDLGDCETVWEIFIREAAGTGALEELARELGTVTARLHAALERAGGIEPGRAPLSERGELEALETLDRVRSELPEEARKLADEVLRARSDIETRLRGAAAGELPRIRVHGDYHLGQLVRRKRDGRVLIVDFEGEPALPLARRRDPAPVFRDLADMLRSFSYARFVGGWRRDREWALRKVFLDAYQAPGVTAARSARPFGEALAAFELEKALREVLYELGHRPDWITIPLRGIVENLESGTD